MSGFASGNLILKSRAHLAEKHMAPRSCLIELSERWLGYFTPSAAGFYDAGIAELRRALTPEGIRADRFYPAQCFCEALEIGEEMEFLNFDKVDEYADEFTVLAKKQLYGGRALF